MNYQQQLECILNEITQEMLDDNYPPEDLNFSREQILEILMDIECAAEEALKILIKKGY